MGMSKLTGLVIVTLLIAGTSPVSAASAPKPGTKCAKAGLVQAVAGKKYTCTKSGTKLIWNKGVTLPAKSTPNVSASSEPTASPVEAKTSASASASTAAALIKFKNCTEAKAAGAAPLNKTKTPDLYELNAGLDRDKDGVACE